LIDDPFMLLFSNSMDDLAAIDRIFMEQALGEARRAADAGEIPVGALVVAGGAVLACGYNRREELQSPTAHAEILAMEAASKRLKSWRLEECSVYVTLEPCIMCVGAMLQARVARLVFGCRDSKAGAVQSLYRLCEDPRLNHRLPVTAGVLEEECSAMLSDFFAALRKRKQNLEARI
jgi:tRNA(adenine34) deaminase